MKLTERDVRLVRDVALSGVLCRSQVVRLGYFSSVSRANRRLRALCGEGMLKPVDTPFHARRLYVPGLAAVSVLGDEVARLVSHRSGTPRFLQHALAVTELRIGLADADRKWRFEGQARHRFAFGKREHDLRPDGLLLSESGAMFVEADLGHVSLPRFARRFEGYRAYFGGGSFASVYGSRKHRILVVTTGELRRSHVSKAAKDAGVDADVTTFAALGIPVLGGWS
ncbi:MAG: replication-relaxation family protein [Armatimonadetes bacterium]|nr:replication-relaxation family protein [Armatimonadota bacterium]